MSKLDFSLEHYISNLINNYIDPIFPIYKITYLHTKSYLKNVYDNDGDYDGKVALIDQNILSEYFQIIPDITIYSNYYFIPLSSKKNIPNNIFKLWIKNKFIKKENESFYLINYHTFFLSHFNISNPNNCFIKNILKNINLLGYTNHIYRIKYTQNDINSKPNEIILETSNYEVVFKSDIKLSSKKNWKTKYLFIQDLKLSGKNVEDNPVSYFYSCVKNSTISLPFLLF